MSAKLRRFLPTLVGLTVLLGTRPIWRLLGPDLEAVGFAERVWINDAIKWTLVAFLLLLVLRWEHQPLSSIGFRKMNRRDLRGALIAFLAGGLIMMLTLPIVSALGLTTTESGVRKVAELSIGQRMVTVLTAGITEETLYRGYLVERLHALTGRLRLSAALSWVFFMAVHVPFWKLGGALQIGLASLVLYVLYLSRRNLPACIVAHVLNNGVAFLLIPIILQQMPR